MATMVMLMIHHYCKKQIERSVTGVFIKFEHKTPASDQWSVNLGAVMDSAPLISQCLSVCIYFGTGASIVCHLYLSFYSVVDRISSCDDWGWCSQLCQCPSETKSEGEQQQQRLLTEDIHLTHQSATSVIHLARLDRHAAAVTQLKVINTSSWVTNRDRGTREQLY